MLPDQPSARDRPWYIAQRWQEYDAERRANLLRIVGIGSLYLVHLMHYHGLGIGALQLADEGSVRWQFHVQVTLLAVIWTMLALGMLLALQQRIFPRWLKLFSTAADLALLTAILLIADGPRSPLVVGYFLVIVLATLRLNLPLVRFATIGSMLGYITLLGCAKWPETFGRDLSGNGDVDLRVPRYEQLIVLVAFALTGIILGQVVRRVRNLAEDFAGRVNTEGEGSP